MARRPKSLWFGSDFHLERFSGMGNLAQMYINAMDEIPPSDCFDGLILVGDVGHSNQIAYLLQAIHDKAKTPIYYTPGNHEFWDGVRLGVTLDQQVQGMREQCEDLPDVHFLYNEGVDIPGTSSSLFMSPWFSDFRGNEEHEKIEGCIGDYYRTLVQDGAKARLLKSMDHIQMHREAVEALEKWLAEVLKKGRSPIIATHFAPSRESFHREYEPTGIVAEYFCTDYLDKNYEKFPDETVWIHGHTHYNLDYQVGAVRVVSNQYGYKGEATANLTFNPLMHIKV